MDSNQAGTPAWLFSFVDLAFLMLIAMTQLAPDPATQLNLGEMIVPRIGEKSTTEFSTDSADLWQLRIHPRSDASESPFELVHVAAGATPDLGVRIQKDELRSDLAALKETTTGRPILAPHENSRSQDMLDAAALLEEFWPGRRRATVSRVLANG